MVDPEDNKATTLALGPSSCPPHLHAPFLKIAVGPMNEQVNGLVGCCCWDVKEWGRGEWRQRQQQEKKKLFYVIIKSSWLELLAEAGMGARVGLWSWMGYNKDRFWAK
jgi:hypothetical protein